MFRSHKDICQFMADIQDLQKFFASSEDLHSIVRNRRNGFSQRRDYEFQQDEDDKESFIASISKDGVSCLQKNLVSVRQTKTWKTLDNASNTLFSSTS